MPTSHLGEVDFTAGQVTFYVHLPDGERPRKVMSQLSHKRGKQKQACTSSRQEKFESYFWSFEDKLKINFFELCVFTTVPVSRKSSWHLIWNECSVTKTHNHDIKSNVVCIPLRWVQLALDAHCGLKLWKFVSGSQIRHFSRQKSITMKNIKRLYSDYQILYKK